MEPIEPMNLRDAMPSSPPTPAPVTINQVLQTELVNRIDKVESALKEDGLDYEKFKRATADCQNKFEERRNAYLEIIGKANECIAIVNDASKTADEKRQMVENKLKEIDCVLFPPRVHCSNPV